jgi:dihydrofolate reductase
MNVEFASGDIAEFTRQLKEKENQDIWLVGGSQLIKVFLEEGREGSDSFLWFQLS